MPLAIGAGGPAPHVILAYTDVRPSIRCVLFWDRTAARAEALARENISSRNLDLRRP